MVIEERELNKRITITPITSQVLNNGQPANIDGTPVTRWAHMYQKIGSERDGLGKQIGTDRIHWTLRKDATLFDIKGTVAYGGSEYDITSVREINNWQMQIICIVRY